MTVRAILVDLDGTLVDTSEANYLSYARALAESGISISRKAFELIAGGRNWRQFLPGLIEENGISADPKEIARRKADFYSEYLTEAILNEALISLLKIRKPSSMLAVVTSASAKNAYAVLNHFCLKDLFDLIVTGDDVSTHKPAPDPYIFAADRLGVLPSECIIIEDSDIGVASGIAFGAHVLRVGVVANKPNGIESALKNSGVQ